MGNYKLITLAQSCLHPLFIGASVFLLSFNLSATETDSIKKNKLYLGSGDEPTAINQLLSYDELQSDKFTLTDRSLVFTLHYGDNIDPESLLIFHNGKSYPMLRKPKKGGKEIIRLPLRLNTNYLKLMISNQSEEDEKQWDTDKFEIYKPPVLDTMIMTVPLKRGSKK